MLSNEAIYNFVLILANFYKNYFYKSQWKEIRKRAFLASFIFMCTPQNISSFAISSMTLQLWSITQKKHVADTSLTKQSAENLASCLNSALKAAAVTASEDSKPSFQQQVL